MLPESKQMLSILLDELGHEIQQQAEIKGFFKDTGPKDALVMIALMHSEISEMCEAVRSNLPKADQHCPDYLNEEIELADLFIRALHYASVRNLRIGDAIHAKMAFNRTREHMHGKTI